MLLRIIVVLPSYPHSKFDSHNTQMHYHRLHSFSSIAVNMAALKINTFINNRNDSLWAHHFKLKMNHERAVWTDWLCFPSNLPYWKKYFFIQLTNEFIESFFRRNSSLVSIKKDLYHLRETKHRKSVGNSTNRFLECKPMVFVNSPEKKQNAETNINKMSCIKCQKAIGHQMLYGTRLIDNNKWTVGDGDGVMVL